MLSSLYNYTKLLLWVWGNFRKFDKNVPVFIQYIVSYLILEWILEFDIFRCCLPGMEGLLQRVVKSKKYFRAMLRVLYQTELLASTVPGRHFLKPALYM